MKTLRISAAFFWIILASLTVRAILANGAAAAMIYVDGFSDPNRWLAMLNTDFAIHLLAAGAWVAFRGRSPLAAVGAGIAAAAAGMLFTLPYLIVLTFTEKDMRAVLLGRHA
ncbi:MAG: hypothetical protein ACSLE1_00325 [Sphingobium sp.]